MDDATKKVVVKGMECVYGLTTNEENKIKRLGTHN